MSTKKTWTSNENVLFRYNTHDENKLQLRPQMSLEQFMRNEGTEQAFKTLEFRIHVGAKMLEHFETGPATLEIREAVDLLSGINNNCILNGKWELPTESFDLFRVALNIVDTVQLNCTRKQMLEAYKHTYAKLTKTSVAAQ